MLKRMHADSTGSLSLLFSVLDYLVYTGKRYVSPRSVEDVTIK